MTLLVVVRRRLVKPRPEGQYGECPWSWIHVGTVQTAFLTHPCGRPERWGSAYRTVVWF